MDLILLHGALGCGRHWDQVAGLLQDKCRLHIPDLPGHGSRSGDDTCQTAEALKQSILGYVRDKGLNEYAVAGYSLGGYLALMMAMEQELRPARVICLATKMDWSAETAENEIGKLNREALVPLAEKLEAEHGPAWESLLPRTHAVLRSIGNAPLTLEDMNSIGIPVTMLVGERDKMVTHEETASFAGSIPSGSSGVLPSQPHLLERMDPGLIAGNFIRILNL